MPRCLMAKKRKTYFWPDRTVDGSIEIDDEEEIDVVGGVPSSHEHMLMLTNKRNNTCREIFQTIGEPQFELHTSKPHYSAQHETIHDPATVSNINMISSLTPTTITSPEMPTDIQLSANIPSQLSSFASNNILPTTLLFATQSSSFSRRPPSPTVGATAPSPTPRSPEATSRSMILQHGVY